MIYDLLKDKSVPAVFTLAFVVMTWKVAFLYKDHEDAAKQRAVEIAEIKLRGVNNSESIEELESSNRSTKKQIQHFHPQKISATDERRF